MLVEIALAKGGLKPETLTGALAAALSDKDKTCNCRDAQESGRAAATRDRCRNVADLRQGDINPSRELRLRLRSRMENCSRLLANQGPLAMMAIDKTTFRPVAFDGLTISFTVTGEQGHGLKSETGQHQHGLQEEVKNRNSRQQ